MSTVHDAPFPGAGKTFLIKSADPEMAGKTIRVDDYWDRVMGAGFWLAAMTPAGHNYLLHRAAAALPQDEEIVYGWDANRGGLAVHVSELGPEVPAGGAE